MDGVDCGSDADGAEGANDAEIAACGGDDDDNAVDNVGTAGIIGGTENVDAVDDVDSKTRPRVGHAEMVRIHKAWDPSLCASGDCR